MITADALRDRQARTLRTVFAHPAAHNLSWSEVSSLVAIVGVVTDEPNGKLRCTVAGRSVSFEPEGSQLTEEQVLAVRQFLGSVGLRPADTQGARSDVAAEVAPSAPSPHRATVVMTYRDAQVRGDGETVLVAPQDPRGHLQHMHEKSGQRRGLYHQPQPEYFARIADAVRGYDEVLLLGHGKGHSNAMMQLVAYLDRREPQLAARIAGGVDLDVGAMTDADVDSAVHEFFGELVRPSAR
jgi:hypothetical protein